MACTGCAPTIEKEYRSIPQKDREGRAEYINGVIFKDKEVNVLKYRETRIKKGEAVTTEFGWITSIEITRGNVEKLVRAGRSRWKIENQGLRITFLRLGKLLRILHFPIRAGYDKDFLSELKKG